MKGSLVSTDILKRNWNAYLAAYGDIDPFERERLIEQSVADAVVFTNPGSEGSRRTGLIAHIEDFQTKMNGCYFETEKIFVHHGELLAAWTMHKPDGTKVATGYNFVRPDADGRFVYMAGFFGQEA
ncbi:nuclear transport factor 2 family protein [Rhizobium laguerreae]|uniref:nuclear transport factor 2 family protein n=1 Tax=Rhizobium laguerreae TaxID=1076926 RepID=UPI001C927C75|nr:nuclear transport factor 2 family protein [Rhizobium laguerreae]MBY3416318.1 nuclear transport factor 2 family protein [Rhizobium laguerreae]